MIIDIVQLEYIEPKLRRLLTWLEDETGLTFTITSQYRIGGEGVHSILPLRGTDLRMRHRPIGIEVELLVNQHWTYDYKRPSKTCAMLHGEGSNLHLHVQVHPNTTSNL